MRYGLKAFNILVIYRVTCLLLAALVLWQTLDAAKARRNHDAAIAFTRTYSYRRGCMDALGYHDYDLNDPNNPEDAYEADFRCGFMEHATRSGGDAKPILK
jgi:hypothetical protein